MKTGGPGSGGVFFNPRPGASLPLPDRLLVALERFAAGTLAAPVELAQNAPDVVLVVAHPAAVLDERAHPARGPQPAGEAERLGPALERALEVAQLGRAELWWPASALGLAQPAHSRLLKLLRPAADRLPMDAHRAGPLGLAESLSP